MKKVWFNPKLKLSSKKLFLWTSPCVYVFMKKRKPIYVGSSMWGVARSFDRRHSSEARYLMDEVRIQFYRTVEEARRVEQVLIDRWKPEFNLLVATTLLPRNKQKA